MAEKLNSHGEFQEYNTENGRYGPNTGKTDTEKNEHESNETEFESSSPNDFHKTLSEAKENIPLNKRWRVDLHSIEDYEKDKLFVTKGGSCVAVEPDGNIVSVCRKPKDIYRGSDLLAKALKEGGDRLDAFGDVLFDFYTDNGFEPVSWTPFNEEYAPDEWIEARNQGMDVQKEPVIFYRYTGEYDKETNPFDYEKFLRTTKPYDDYDLAKNRRDAEIRRNKNGIQKFDI